MHDHMEALKQLGSWMVAVRCCYGATCNCKCSELLSEDIFVFRHMTGDCPGALLLVLSTIVGQQSGGRKGMLPTTCCVHVC